MKSKLSIAQFILATVITLTCLSSTAQPYSNSGDHSVCQFTTEPYGVEFTANTTYQWSIIPSGGANGTINAGATGNLITVYWETPGTCELQLIETNTNSCSVLVTISITVNPAPVLVITHPEAVCQPSTVDITAPEITAGSTLPAGTVLTYWADAEATIALSNPSAIAISGTYYIKAATTEGCAHIQAVTVIVNPTPAPVISGADMVCAGDVQVYSVVLSAGNVYEWMVTGGTIATGQGTGQISVTWTNAGSGTVSLTETAGECSATASLDVTVNQLPATITIFHN